MSRSNDASKGTPDDDAERLDDGSDASEDSTSDAEQDVVGDKSADSEQDAEADDDAAEAEADDEDEASEKSTSKDAVAAASRSGRSRGRAANASGSAKAGASAAAAKAPRPKGKRGSVARPTTATGRTGSRAPERGGPIAAIVLFVRQVIAELRKVVTPTGRELGTYTAVVVVFVLIVMAYVGVLDLGIGKLILWAFGG